MFTLLRRISIPHILEHKLRTVLTVLGIALGAATALGMDLTFQPLHASLRKSAQSLSGRAVIQVANGDAGVPEGLLDEIKNVQGVEVAAASIQGTVSLANHEGEQLYIFGVDLLEDQKIRDYDFAGDESSKKQSAVADPLVFLAKADSIAVSVDFLQSLGRRVGDQLEVISPVGHRHLTIRGSLDTSSGPASLFGGRIALMDIFAAQKLLQLDHRLGQIDVSVKRGVSAAAVQKAIEGIVSGRALVTSENRNLEGLEFTLRMTEQAIYGANNIAGLLAMYIVFNTMLIAVAQRRREIGILRAAGARRRAVIGLVMLDAAVYATLAAPIGILLGIGLARFFSIHFLPMIGSTYAPATPPAISLQWNKMLLTLAQALAAAPVAALIPAFEAAAVHPIEAMRRSATAPPKRGSIYLRLGMAGVLMLIIGEGAALLMPPRWFTDQGTFLAVRFGTSYSTFVWAILFLSPMLIRAAALGIEPLLARSFAGLGTLASRGIVRNMRRFALTGTAFVVSVMMAVFLAGLWSTAIYHADRFADSMLGGMDIVISGAPSFEMRNDKVLPGRLVTEIAQIAGVAEVPAIRVTAHDFGGRQGNLVALDSRPRQPGFRLTTGDQAKVIDEFIHGHGILMDETCAHTHGLDVGDLFSFTTPRGALRLPILGLTEVTFALAGGNDTISIARSLYRDYWRDDSVSLIGPVLAPGADRAAVIEQIRARFGQQNHLYVLALADFRRQIEHRFSSELAPLIPIFLFATVIALFGLVNSLFASVLDRTREIGALRSLGGTRSQIGLLILFEAAALGIIGTLVAIPAGMAMNLLNQFQNELFMGTYFPFKAPSLPILAGLFFTTALLAALGGYLPGRRAASVVITEALKSE